MTFIIPYDYRRNSGHLRLSDVNEGIILCHKLGWSPIGVIVGQKEKDDIRRITFSGASQQGIRGITQIFRAWKCPISFSSAEYELSFICETCHKFNPIKFPQRTV